MRNLKKILALVLALMMVLSVMVTASAASPLEKYKDYASINPAYEQAVEVMTAAGVFSGGDNGFEPGRVLTRAEAATLITILATGGEIDGIVKCETNFEDVAATHWASGFITYCFDTGLILGTNAEMTQYSPSLELSYEQYAAMLLRVLDVDCTTTGKWYVPVRNNAVKCGLMAGIESYVWTAGLTREAACQMTFNAMHYGAGKTTEAVAAEYAVVVTDSKGTDETTDDVQTTYKFSTSADAYFFATAKNAEANMTAVVNYTPAGTKEVETSALLTAFGIKKTYENDPYGAPADKYVIGEGEKAVTLYYAEGDDFVYESKTLATTIAKDLKGYSMVIGSDLSVKVENTKDKYNFNDTKGAIVYVDGKAASTLNIVGNLGTGEDNKVTLSAALAALTDDNAVVRIYTDDETKMITNIVVTNTYVDTVKEVIEANAEKKIKAAIVLTDGGKVETTGYAEGDVVTYTKCNGTVEDLAKAEYFVGTLTGWNSDNEYTINDKTYTLALDAETQVPAIRLTQFGKPYAYYEGANNTIIYASAVPGTAPETPALEADGYAMVMDAYVGITKDEVGTTDIWTGATVYADPTVVVMLKVITDDGSVIACEVPVAQADDEHKTLSEGDYYVTIAKNTYKVCDKDGNNAMTSDDLAEKFTNIYTYAVTEDGTSLLAAAPALSTFYSSTTGGAGQQQTITTITAGTLALTKGYNSDKAIVLLSDETVFVLGVDSDDDEKIDGYTTKTTAELAGTEVPTQSKLIINVATDGKKAENNVYTASVVFAFKTPYNASTEAEETKDYVYIASGDYVVSGLDEAGKPVYTYSGLLLNGNVVNVDSDKSNLGGIYYLNTDGSVGTNVTESFTTATISTAAAGKYILSTNAIVTTDEDTVVVGGELVAGAKMMYIDAKNDKVLDVVYVIEMPEAK